MIFDILQKLDGSLENVENTSRTGRPFRIRRGGRQHRAAGAQKLFDGGIVECRRSKSGGSAWVVVFAGHAGNHAASRSYRRGARLQLTGKTRFMSFDDRVCVEEPIEDDLFYS